MSKTKNITIINNRVATGRTTREQYTTVFIIKSLDMVREGERGGGNTEGGKERGKRKNKIITNMTCNKYNYTLYYVIILIFSLYRFISLLARLVYLLLF